MAKKRDKYGRYVSTGKHKKAKKKASHKKKHRPSQKVTLCAAVRRVGIKSKKGTSARPAWVGINCKKVSRKRVHMSYGPRVGRFGGFKPRQVISDGPFSYED